MKISLTIAIASLFSVCIAGQCQPDNRPHPVRRERPPPAPQAPENAEQRSQVRAPQLPVSRRHGLRDARPDEKEKEPQSGFVQAHYHVAKVIDRFVQRSLVATKVVGCFALGAVGSLAVGAAAANQEDYRVSENNTEETPPQKIAQAPTNPKPQKATPSHHNPQIKTLNPKKGPPTRLWRA